MQRLEVSGAVREIYIYNVSGLRVNSVFQSLNSHMSNIKYARMKLRFPLLCEGNVVLRAGNSVSDATKLSPTLLSLKITLHTVNLRITTYATNIKYARMKLRFPMLCEGNGSSSCR
jgi:hypothetical protein